MISKRETSTKSTGLASKCLKFDMWDCDCDENCATITFNSLQPIFIMILIVWSYYCFIIEICILKVFNVSLIKFFVYLLPTTLVFILMVWAFLASIFTPTATVPDKYEVPPSLVQRLQTASRDAEASNILINYMRSTDITVVTRTENGGIRYCSKCVLIKPDRTHHCSTCKMCVLKMDHHCPWTNCCISFSNYKQFLLFNFYCVIYLIILTMVSLEFVFRFFVATQKSWRDIQLIVLNCCQVFAVTIIIVYMFITYYQAIVEICVVKIKESGVHYTHVILITFLFIMMLWSLAATVYAELPLVPLRYSVSCQERCALQRADCPENLEIILTGICYERRIQLWTRSGQGIIRYCMICGKVQPDRAHHCNSCGVCVLRFQKHCWWISSCINFNNYKMYILFIFYTMLYSAYLFGITVDQLVQYHEMKTKDRVQFIILCVVAAVMLCLLITLLSYHLRLVFSNQTTLEEMGETYFVYHEPLTFNISPCYNWKEVFGDVICLWWIPVFSGLGNGCEFYTTFN